MTTTQKQTNDYTKFYCCKFCKQYGKLDAIKEFLDAEDAAETATLNCGCADAIKYQTRIKNIERLKQAKEELRGYFTKRAAFEPNQELLDMFFNCGISVLDRVIRKCTLEVYGIKIALQCSKKNYLTISFKFSDGYEIEI